MNDSDGKAEKLRPLRLNSRTTPVRRDSLHPPRRVKGAVYRSGPGSPRPGWMRTGRCPAETAPPEACRGHSTRANRSTAHLEVRDLSLGHGCVLLQRVPFGMAFT